MASDSVKAEAWNKKWHVRMTFQVLGIWRGMHGVVLKDGTIIFFIVIFCFWIVVFQLQ
jgi:hypothetical protein